MPNTTQERGDFYDQFTSFFRQLMGWAIGLALLILLMAAGLFAWHVGTPLNLQISSQSTEWARFGGYFSGVTGPLLTFLTFVMLIASQRAQMAQVQKEQERATRSAAVEHLRWEYERLEDVSAQQQELAEKIRDEIEALLNLPADPAKTGRTTRFLLGKLHDHTLTIEETWDHLDTFSGAEALSRLARRLVDLSRNQSVIATTRARLERLRSRISAATGSTEYPPSADEHVSQPFDDVVRGLIDLAKYGRALPYADIDFSYLFWMFSMGAAFELSLAFDESLV